MGVLDGIRIIEIAGIGPAPFCGMLLADMGAEVILIERIDTCGSDPLSLGTNAIINRGKKSLALNLKDPRAIAAVLRLISTADGLIEGMRPGTMERLGLGPELSLQVNPCLVYGRMTGWGQDGPLAKTAGHDINYMALSGALWFAGSPGSIPTAAPTLVGDLGGGALYLAMGMLAGILNARTTGAGQVVDAAIVDGSANLMNLLLSIHAAGMQPFERGTGLLDGPHWYGSYICADGLLVSVGALEPKFNQLLFDKLGLADDAEFKHPYDAKKWLRLRERLSSIFSQYPRSHWEALFDGIDACFAPLLTPEQSMVHPHMQARNIYSKHNGILQAAPAPRFSITPSAEHANVPESGEHSLEILRSIGLSRDDIELLMRGT